MDRSTRAKRRRIDPSPPPVRRDTTLHSPVETSSDELAAGSDHDEAERRRASWNLQKAYPPKRPYPRSRSFSGSESPDELTMDVEDVYWRTTRHRASPSEAASERDDHDHDHDHDDNNDDDDDNDDAQPDDDQDEDEAISGDIDDTETGVDAAETPYIDRSPTPVPPPPPPPPPKPEKLNYRPKFLLRGHLRGVSAVQFSPDGSMIASGGADGAVKVWDTRSGKLIHTFEGHLAGISTISWGPDGATLASGSDDKTIRLWNVLTGKAHPIPLAGHHNYVYQIAFSPKGNMLVSGSYDEAVFLWDVRSASVMRSLPAHSDPVGGIDVVWDGTLIASCATDGLIRIWDTATGQCLRTLVHEDNPPVTAVKFSPNGKFVLAWTLDDCVRLWNYVEGRCIKTYQGHVNRKYSLSGGFGVYSAPGGPAEAFAVSGSEDGAVLCWDVVSKKILQRLEGHSGVVLGVDTCALAGTRYMVSCGLDGTVRVYEEVEETEPEPGPEPEAKDEDADEDREKTPVPMSMSGTEDMPMQGDTPLPETTPVSGATPISGETSLPNGVETEAVQDTEMGEAEALDE